MSKRTIKFTVPTEPRRDSACPTCHMTEAQEHHMNIYCGVFECPGGPQHAHDSDEIEQRIAEGQAARWDHEKHCVACPDEWHHDEVERELPACWDICPRCDGEGTHVNPSIDGNGITADEWNGPDWDDDAKEMYLSGGYDVPCEAGCKNGKVLVPDEAACANEPLKALLARYQKMQEDEARQRREDQRTLYMESGGREGRW